MRIISIILIIIGIVFGLLGVRSYWREKSYEKASIAVKALVKSAEVKPKSGKGMVGIEMILTYNRDGVADSIEHNFSAPYSTNNPMPAEVELKAASYYVRYVPTEKRSKTIPNWVMVSNNGKFDGLYGRALFGQMFTFIVLGFMVKIFSRKRSPENS